MRVLHVASEVAPFAQSGGLADVLAGLPAAQAAHGLDVAVLVPLYRGVAARVAAHGLTLEPGAAITLSVGVHTLPASIRRVRVGRVHHGFLDCAPLFDRAGGMYGPGGAADWPDNHVRFAALGAAALAAGPLLLGGTPEVLHVHDWQGAPAAIYARLAGSTSTIVTTIHNLAYRGIFPKYVMDELGLPWTVFTLRQLEFHDQLCLLKGGLAASDVITTVSPTYAREILTPTFGEGLDGFLRNDVRPVIGILNGIDADAWDPRRDAAIAAPFSADDATGKAACRAALADETGLEPGRDEPLIGVIARMTGQKGLDLVADIVPDLYRLGARIVILGAGEPAYEERFRYLASAFTAHVSTRIGFDIEFARRIYAGVDLFLMPSRFEPCGLGQLYAMRYGAVPIVHAVGGLVDTVRDDGDAALARGDGTGFQFSPASAQGMHQALARAVAMYRDRPAFARLRRAAMQRDSSWVTSASAYEALYRDTRGEPPSLGDAAVPMG